MQKQTFNRLAAFFILAQVIIIFVTVFLFAPPITEGRLVAWIFSGLLIATLYNAALIGFLPAFWQAKVKAMQWYLFVSPIYFVFFVLMVTAGGGISLIGVLLSALCLIQYAFAIAAIRAEKSNPIV